MTLYADGVHLVLIVHLKFLGHRIEQLHLGIDGSGIVVAQRVDDLVADTRLQGEGLLL